jgi:hypothetical protein
MTAMIPFNFEGAELRAMLIDEAPWWVANDLCKLLGINNARQAVARLDDDQKGVTQADTLGGVQTLSIVCESGMWTLVLRSDKPEAKRVRRWLTDEVLPSLRQHGSYTMPGATPSGEPKWEDSDVPRLSASVAAVRTAMRLFGTRAARAVWYELGLPRPADSIETQGGSSASDPLLDAVRECLAAVDCATVEDVAQAIGFDLGDGLKGRLRIARMLRWLGWQPKPEFRRGAGKVNMWRPEFAEDLAGETEIAP